MDVLFEYSMWVGGSPPKHKLSCQGALCCGSSTVQYICRGANLFCSAVSSPGTTLSWQQPMRPVTSRTLVSGWVRSSSRDSSLLLYLCHESGHQSYRTPSRSRNAIGMVMLHKHNPQAKQQLDEPTPNWTPQLTSSSDTFMSQ